jgi:LAO/AO transport system kinase
MAEPWERMIAAVKDGDVRALAKLITYVENREAGWKDAMKVVYPLAGTSTVFGITGSPGAGKSTLTNAIARRLCDQGFSIGIIAVDPSSPFSGGALLGDRIRMRDISVDSRIFIRSMATRGVLGGLCQAARDVARILDASGKDVVIIETVGVGQDEIEVVRASEFVMLICFPGQGDSIQAIKAGTMEIADLFVVNKADREGADEMVEEIEAMLTLSGQEGVQTPQVMKTSSVTKEGLDDLVTFLRAFMQTKKRRDRERGLVREEILSLMEHEVSRMVRERLTQDGRLEHAIERILAQEVDPYTAVEEMLQKFSIPTPGL